MNEGEGLPLDTARTRAARGGASPPSIVIRETPERDGWIIEAYGAQIAAPFPLCNAECPPEGEPTPEYLEALELAADRFLSEYEAGAATLPARLLRLAERIAQETDTIPDFLLLGMHAQRQGDAEGAPGAPTGDSPPEAPSAPDSPA